MRRERNGMMGQNNESFVFLKSAWKEMLATITGAQFNSLEQKPWERSMIEASNVES